MRKLLFKCLILSAIFTMVGCSNDLNDVEINKQKIDDSELQAAELGMNLMESFKASPLKSSSDMVYPDYYCGAYINADKKFVVLVNDNSNNVQENLILRTKGSNFIVENATFTMNELLETIDILNELFFDKTKESFLSDIGLKGFGIIPSENRVFVELKNCSDNNISLFKNRVLNSPMLKFTPSKGDVVAEETIAPGSGLKATSTGSFGYRARLNGQTGLVTAGHVARSVGVNVYKDFDVPYPSELIGTCAATQIGGSVDAAFIRLTGSYTAGNYTAWGTTISSVVEPAYQGATVYKEGKNGFSTGSITATNVSKTINFPSGGSATLWGLIEASYSSAGGDSGGIIYSGSNNILGTHEGSGGGSAYFIYAGDINNTFGLSTY